MNYSPQRRVNENYALRQENARLRNWAKRVAECPCCNNCGNQKTCDAKPGWGEICAINCPLWVEYSRTDEREPMPLVWNYHSENPIKIGAIIQIDGRDFLYRGLNSDGWPTFDAVGLDLSKGPDLTAVYSDEGIYKAKPIDKEIGATFDEDIYGKGQNNEHIRH